MQMIERLIVAAPLIGVIAGYLAFRGGKKVLSANQKEQVDTLARTAWGEARGEGLQGLQAVCNVVMNRVKRGGWYGVTPKEVCLKPYQFSCWLTSDPNRSKLLAVDESDEQFRQAKEIATLAVQGVLPDITGGAINYLALNSLSKMPSWTKTMKKTASIGNHTFYA